MQILRASRDKVAGSKDGSNRYHFIFLDKNHPPSAIFKAIDDINSGVGNGGKEFVIKKLYLIPKL
jgi:hypothetical protein